MSVFMRLLYFKNKQTLSKDIVCKETYVKEQNKQY